MTTLAVNNPTLVDVAKRLDPDGAVADVAMLLSQTNEILTDCVFMQGNLPTGHRVTVQTGLPKVYYRALNEGVPPSKATTAQVDEGCSMLEARSEVDIKVAKLNGNEGQYRMSEDKMFLEAMNQTQAETLFYGNPKVDKKKHLGFATRYSDLNAGNAQNILDAGGTGTDNTSIWLVCWSDNTVFCPYPKGSQAGLVHRDLGEQTVHKQDGTRLQAYETIYNWDSGLVVKDWRYVVRICNVDVSDLKAQTGTQDPAAATNIIGLMDDAVYRIPNINMGRTAFYMNRTVHSGLSRLAKKQASNVLAVEKGLDQFGRPHTWTSFLGLPLRKTDQLLNTEARVV